MANDGFYGKLGEAFNAVAEAGKLEVRARLVQEKQLANLVRGSEMGRTVQEEAMPAIEAAYKTGVMPKLLGA